MATAPSNEKLFPTLDGDDMAALAAQATCQSFEPGEKILACGDEDIDLLVVESGAVDVLNPTDNYNCIVTHGPGQFVGDIDLLTRRPIVFDAVAAAGETTRVLRVPGDKLRHLLNTIPSLGEKLIVAFQARRDALARKGVAGIRVVGPAHCPDTNRVREFLFKNFVPFVWSDVDTPAAKAVLDAVAGDGLPVVDCGNKILRKPTLHELAEWAGVWRGCPGDHDIDLVVVGAGPAGLAAAVYAASEGLKTVVLDKLGPGGQAGGSSRIENFIGFPAGLSGTDLATRGALQMLKFGARMVAPVIVKEIEVGQGNDPHQLHLDCGVTLRAHTVLATTGVHWRKLPAENAERFERAGVYYACTSVEAVLHEGCDVVVVGGGNSAGQAVMFLSGQDHRRKVHLLVRSPLGTSMSDYLVERIRTASNVQVHEGAEVTRVNGGRAIESVDLRRRDSSQPTNLPCSAVFVFIGAEPGSQWLPKEVARDKLGYVLTGVEVAESGKWPLKDRLPCPLETTVPRLLAGGDLRSGSTKRVGFAVGDGSLAVTCVHKLRQIGAGA